MACPTNEDDDSPEPLRFVLIEDSPDARLFVELSSYSSDLSQAAQSLDFAIEGDDPSSPYAPAQSLLIGYAAIAYFRGVTPSKARDGIGQHVAVPSELLGTHELVMAFRNRSIAHSQSELTSTYPIGVVVSETSEVRGVMAATVVVPLPPSVVRNFRDLVVRMLELLDDVILPVRLRLEDALRSADPSDLLSRPAPAIIHEVAENFDPRKTRSPYPKSQTLYWEPPNGSGRPPRM